MQTTSTNYGLAGGVLDASRHVAAAASRLCTPSEVHASQQLRALVDAHRLAESAARN